MEPWWHWLVTALGGGIVVGLLSLWGERMRTRASDRTRWLDTRRDLAARFLHATDELFKWTLAQSNMMRARQANTPVLFVDDVTDVESAMRKVSEASTAVGRIGTEIDLVGSQAEREAATRLAESVWGVARANGSDPGEGFKDRMDTALKENRDAREAFRDAVREGLVPPKRRFFARRA